jgi:AmiR/NasT family two-component response regulator
MLTALETIGIQLSLYAERLRLEQRRTVLKQQVALQREELATRKAVARATGILTREYGLSAEGAKKWLEVEAAPAGR